MIISYELENFIIHVNTGPTSDKSLFYITLRENPKIALVLSLKKWLYKNTFYV